MSISALFCHDFRLLIHGSLASLAPVPPVFSNLLGGLVQPVLLSGEPNHSTAANHFGAFGAGSPSGVSLPTASKICMSLSVNPSSFAVAGTSKRAGKPLAAHVAGVVCLKSSVKTSSRHSSSSSHRGATRAARGYQEQHPRIQQPAELPIRCTVSYYGSRRVRSSCSAFSAPPQKKFTSPLSGMFLTRHPNYIQCRSNQTTKQNT